MTFFFHRLDRKRDRTERIHDVLIAAKDGEIPSKIMYASSISWAPLQKILKVTEDAKLIVKVDIGDSSWKKRSTLGWKTTEKGLKYARGVYDNSRLLLVREAEEEV